MTEPERVIEYLHKKNTYVLPAGTRVHVVCDSLFAEINRSRIREMSNFLSGKIPIDEFYDYRIGLPITGVGSALIKEYEAIAHFFERNRAFSFLKFDHATSHELALCTFFKPMDFVRAGNLVAELNRALPSIINIFRRPLIHLRQAEIIQPVDAVKRVNHNTVRHLTQHSENWKDIDYANDQIVPARLLTRVYEDDYSIYENVVFRDLIDNVLTFLRKRIYYLTEILETFKESIQLDAVNRFNHQKYYLAIGKLYVGFYKMENSSEIQSALENLKQLYKRINAYKGRAVYTRNANIKVAAGAIKRTNILTMHKDYKHVLSLSQKFRSSEVESKDAGSAELQQKSQLSYERFCAMLIVFAVSNFNMECLGDDAIFIDGMLDASFEHKNWTMNIKSEFSPILGFNIIKMSINYKNATRTLGIIPMTYYLSNEKKRIYEAIVKRLYRTGKVFDKYVFLEPFEGGDNSLLNYSIMLPLKEAKTYYSVLPVSITDINSFRRIQKLLFECMVLSNEENDVCAFCGEALSREPDGTFLCKKCRTAVQEITCEGCGNHFMGTFVAIKTQSNNKQAQDDEALKELPEFFRQEKKYLFRNIVNMNKNNYICPACGCENSGKGTRN